MTLRVYLDGAELDPGRLLLPVDQGLSQNADGTTAVGGVVIDDPDGDLVIEGWQSLIVEEDDCTPARIYTGWVFSKGISRGPYGDGAARQWDCDLADINQYLHFHALRGADDSAERPAETGSERIAWLMGTTGLDGIVFDNGLITANAWEYDEADYRGQYADDVLRDIISADTDGRWTFFLYYDETAATGEEVSLFYGQITATSMTSTLGISNVIADHSSTVIYPSKDASLARDPSQQYGGIYVYGTFGRLYRTNAVTVAQMGLPVTRDGVYTSDRLINTATAERHAATWLAWHSTENDVIDVTVELPSTQVNLIQAGSRLPVKFSHLPGYETSTYTRVQTRDVSLAETWLYKVHLQLSLKGINQIGGGNPGVTPNPPPTPGQEHFYEVTVTDTTPLGGPDVTTWATATIDLVNSTTYNWFAEITYSAGIVGTSAFVNILFDNAISGHYINQNYGAGVGSGTKSGSFTSPTGVTNPAKFGVNVVHNDSSISTATVHFYIDPAGWVPIPPSTGAPSPGQWVYQEVVTLAGAVGTTAWPYATGSLHIYVSGLPISSASFTETDPSAGTFTLDWTPDTDEVVRVDYQGR